MAVSLFFFAVHDLYHPSGKAPGSPGVHILNDIYLILHLCCQFVDSPAIAQASSVIDQEDMAVV